MSRTLERRAKHLRASYTWEPKRFAGRNIDRNGSHGLDTCTPQQRALRFFLGMLFLNQGDQIAVGQRELATCGSTEILRQDIVISPWHNELALLTDIHHHFVQKILPWDTIGSVSGIPGLRRYDADEHGQWYRFLHLPTGGLLRLQGLQKSKHHYMAPIADKDGYRWPSNWGASNVHVPLSPGEARIARAMPAADEDLQTLIAGIVVRLTSQHPHGAWALGSLLWDPLHRGRAMSFPRLRRTLWRTKDQWHLAFNGPVPAEDIASALTDPGIGIPGADTSGSARRIAVTLGSATLHIRNFRPSDKDRHWLPQAT